LYEGFLDPDNRKDFPWEKIDKNNEVKPDYHHEKKVFNHLKKIIRTRKEI